MKSFAHSLVLAVIWGLFANVAWSDELVADAVHDRGSLHRVWYRDFDEAKQAAQELGRPVMLVFR